MDRGFMDRGRSAAGVNPPAASAPVATSSPGFVKEFSNEVGDVLQGRISLVMLNSMALGIVLFYIWTRRAQGGG